MPLISKDGLTDLQIGDLVNMEWVVAHIHPETHVVTLTRDGSLGLRADSPQMVTIRVDALEADLESVGGEGLAMGSVVTVPWRVAQVFPETSTVSVVRDGVVLMGEAPQGVTLLVGALASDLAIVPPPAPPPG